MIFIQLTIDNKSDREFVETLFQENAERMYKMAFRILMDQYLAEDAVQISFENIIKYLPRIKRIPPHKFSAYLTVICKNVARELYKDQLRRNSEGEYIDDFEDDIKDPPDIVISKDEVSHLVNLIQSLRPIYADVLMLKYFCELDEDIIADALNISLHNVRKRITRGKKMLEEMLREEGFDDFTLE